MSRALAFSLFVCAAFAWVPPFIDRAGLAALGFAFLALAISPGRWLTSRPARMTSSLERMDTGAPRFPETEKLLAMTGSLLDDLNSEKGDGDSDLLARMAPYLNLPDPAARGSS